MISNFELPMHLKEIVEKELDSGERVQWFEQPKPNYFSSSSMGTFLFAIPWTAFAIFWIVGASQSSSAVFPLFGVPFVLIGIAMLSSPLWTYFKATKSVYVITNQRAIIFDGGLSFTIRSYSPDQLQNIHRREKKNGLGDIVISYETWNDSKGYSRKKELGFMNIREPKSVEKKLRLLAEQKK